MRERSGVIQPPSQSEHGRETDVQRGTLLFGLLSVLWCASASPAAGDSRFDGTWNVTLACPEASDGTLPFTWVFTADVKDGVLHGERGRAGEPASMSLDGPIQPDGTANLHAHGLTGDQNHAIHHVRPSTQFEHPVTARFDAARGTGHWQAIRICNFTFSRQ